MKINLIVWCSLWLTVLCGQSLVGVAQDTSAADHPVDHVWAGVAYEFDYHLLPLNRDAERAIFEDKLRKIDGSTFTSIRPYRPQTVDNFDDIQEILAARKGVDQGESAFDPLMKIINPRFKGSLFNKNWSLQLSPYVAFLTGFEAGDTLSGYTQTAAGGLRLRGFYSKKLLGEVSYLWGHRLPNVFDEGLATEREVVAGQGYADPSGNGYAYQRLTYRLNYSPDDIFNLELGRGKHFWGNGYRSLLLSDISAPMDYFKTSATIWRIKYVNLYTGMRDIRGANGVPADYRKKYSTMHYLGINIGSRLNIGLFESVIWQGSDTLVETGFDPNYLNPIIFFRPVEFSTGSAHNSLIGLDMSYKFSARFLAYGQIVIDEFLVGDLRAAEGSWRNKHGLQLGLRHFDVANVDGLHALAEFNYVRPYTYTHGSVQQNYAHFGQPLAHPLGANFWEAVLLCNYTQKRNTFEVKSTYSVFGSDYAGRNLGGDLFRTYQIREDDLNNYTTQGVEERLWQTTLRFSHLLHIASNLRFEAGLTHRQFARQGGDYSTNWLQLGIRTALFNADNDF